MPVTHSADGTEVYIAHKDREIDMTPENALDLYLELGDAIEGARVARELAEREVRDVV